MSQEDSLNDPSPLRFYMERNPNLTLQECLVAFREYSDEQIQSNFHKNVTAIKKGFDLEIKTRAKNPVTFDELSSKPQ